MILSFSFKTFFNTLIGKSLIVFAIYMTLGFGLKLIIDDDVLRRIISKMIPVLMVCYFIWQERGVHKVLFSKGRLSALSMVLTLLLVYWAISGMDAFQNVGHTALFIHIVRNIQTGIFLRKAC